MSVCAGDDLGTVSKSWPDAGTVLLETQVLEIRSMVTAGIRADQASVEVSVWRRSMVAGLMDGVRSRECSVQRMFLPQIYWWRLMRAENKEDGLAGVSVYC